MRGGSGVRWSYKPWRERSQTERIEAYTGWSLFPLSAMPPLIYALQLVVGPPVGWLAWPLLVPYLAHTALCLLMLTRTLGGGPIDRRLALAQLVFVAVLLVGLGLTRGPGEVGFLSTAVFAQALVVTGTAASWAPALSANKIGLVGLAGAAILLLVQLPAGIPYVFAFGVPLGFWSFVWLSVYGTSAWILRVVRELDLARGTAARLAVAEERLRFSRDLHDVFGRALATVAVKSELAAELTRRRPDDAANTMLEVRQLAQDSLAEVRAVAAGYRQSDLGHELRGAKALLDSAGVACTVLGEEVEFPGPVQTAFGWVVREAVTNVIKHSTASTCTITLSREPGWCRLEVINNGVEARPSGGGSGLTGLRERLGPLGGRLDAGQDGDTYTLLATLPTKTPPTETLPTEERR